MPKSLEKTRKKISKKKGNITALHENSRDSQRLRRAAMRDEKLQRVGAARKKIDQPHLTRTAFFQECIRKNDSKPLDIAQVQKLIELYADPNLQSILYVNQNDEELIALKKARRPGRPTSTREDLLSIKIATDKKEWDTGFFLPDLTDTANIVLLDRWDGTWSYLPTLKWVRISKVGLVQTSSFPPKG